MNRVLRAGLLLVGMAAGLVAACGDDQQVVGSHESGGNGAHAGNAGHAGSGAGGHAGTGTGGAAAGHGGGSAGITGGASGHGGSGEAGRGGTSGTSGTSAGGTGAAGHAGAAHGGGAGSGGSGGDAGSGGSSGDAGAAGATTCPVDCTGSLAGEGGPCVAGEESLWYCHGGATPDYEFLSSHCESTNIMTPQPGFCCAPDFLPECLLH